MTLTSEENQNRRSFSIKKLFFITVAFLLLLSLIVATSGRSLLGRLDHILLHSSKSSLGCNNHDEWTTFVTPIKYVGESNSIVDSVEEYPMGILDQSLWFIVRKFVFPYFTDRSLSVDDGRCQVVNLYQRYRCHFRMDQLFLKRFPYWHEFEMVDASIHSSSYCNVYSTMEESTTTSRNDESVDYFTPFLGREFQNIINVGIVNNERSEPTIGEGSAAPALFKPTIVPAVEVQKLQVKWNSFTKPIIDVNVSGIVVNFVIGQQEQYDINGISIPPLPNLRLGNTTFDEVFSLLPPPPEEEGLYPRMGVTNITNVTILIHHMPSDDDDIPNEKTTLVMPDELFLPLLQVTIDGRDEGIDQILISSLLKESVIMSIRKYVLGEDKIRTSLNKYGEIYGGIIETTMSAISQKIQESGDAMDNHLTQAMTKTKEVVQMVGEEWLDALEKEQNSISMIFEDMKREWVSIVEKSKLESNELGAMLKGVENNIATQWESMKKEASGVQQQVVQNIDVLGMNIKNDFENTQKKLEKKVKNHVLPMITKLVDSWGLGDTKDRK